MGQKLGIADDAIGHTNGRPNTFDDSCRPISFGVCVVRGAIPVHDDDALRFEMHVEQPVVLSHELCERWDSCSIALSFTPLCAQLHGFHALSLPFTFPRSFRVR